MIESIYRYGVVSAEGSEVFDDPVAALQYAAYMESIGSDSVFFICGDFDGKTIRLKRVSVYDIKRAIKGDARGEAGSHEQQLPRSQRA